MFECLTKLKKVFQGPTDKNICPVRAPKKKMLVLDVWRWIGPAPDRWTPGNRWTVDRPLSHFSLFTCLWVASFDWNFTWLNFKCNSIRWARAFSADFQDEKISRPLAVKIWICRSLCLPGRFSTCGSRWLISILARWDNKIRFKPFHFCLES